MAKYELGVRTKNGPSKLYVFASGKRYAKEEDAQKYAEAENQLMEGSEYEYRFEKTTLHFAENVIVRPSEDEASRGRFLTGNYVGRLHLDILDEHEEVTGGIDFEIRSQKASYREDYRKMLNDITAYYTELVMQAGSPVTQHFIPTDEEERKTLYQKFAFVKSLIDTAEFEDSLQKILYNPVRAWTETTVERPITAIRRIGRRGLRQMVSRTNRINAPEGLSKEIGLSTVPRTVSVDYRKDSVDTPENRFVKFALNSFHLFCSYIQTLKNANERLRAEAAMCCMKLERMLNNAFFKEVGSPQYIELNSPVLQRKEGYKEVLQAWVMFDLAAKLTWDGGDNVYEAGKKNIAALYEYWLFFKLLEVVSKKFNLNPKDKSALVKTDGDKINLEVKQGRMIMVGGVYRTETRDLNVRFYYNRTFNHEADIEKCGSWTTAMRPDYTLTVWPGDMDEPMAEAQNAIVHIHFDAKYKVNQILLLNDKEDSHGTISEVLDEEKEEEEIGIYKRGDLLKMHAYNDAIRRTGGSYVLYPGTEDNTLRGFHEIIPGLGAFAVRPNRVEQDMKELRKFIDDLIKHFLNRISQWEQMAFHDYEILNRPTEALNDAMPEPYGTERDAMPTDMNVLIGYYKDSGHLEWILDNMKYNLRTGNSKGSLNLDVRVMSAKYVFLHGPKGSEQLLLRLDGKGARVYSKEKLIEVFCYEGCSYEPKSCDYYIVFSLARKTMEREFEGKVWDVDKMVEDGILLNLRGAGMPKSITLAELMKYVKRTE